MTYTRIIKMMVKIIFQIKSSSEITSSVIQFEIYLVLTNYYYFHFQINYNYLTLIHILQLLTYYLLI